MNEQFAILQEFRENLAFGIMIKWSLWADGKKHDQKSVTVAFYSIKRRLKTSWDENMQNFESATCKMNKSNLMYSVDLLS